MKAVFLSPPTIMKRARVFVSYKFWFTSALGCEARRIVFCGWGGRRPRKKEQQEKEKTEKKKNRQKKKKRKINKKKK